MRANHFRTELAPATKANSREAFQRTEQKLLISDLCEERDTPTCVRIESPTVEPVKQRGKPRDGLAYGKLSVGLRYAKSFQQQPEELQANLINWGIRQPSAVSRQPSAVSRQPSAVSRQPSAVSRQPSAVSRQPARSSLASKHLRKPGGRGGRGSGAKNHVNQEGNCPMPFPPAVDRTPKIISVEERPAPQQAEAVVIEPEEELAVDDFVLLPNPLTEGQVAEPAEAVTPPPANSPLDIPTYLPIEIPQDTSAPTYLPLDAGDVFEAPQLPPEEFQEAPEPSEAPAGSPQPFPSSLPEPEEAQSRGPIDVPAPPAAATTGRGTRTRGRARGSSSRGASDNGGGAVRTRSRSRSQG
ncbi:E3 ubiquitin-protein ligase RNF12-B-like [Penaeus monodon]|uniref:E3 ubiquitin-protein ligase RNF12-B-like n=1 Tax=Penaeus monodon TaxID=6687 RepID=UPI0018A731FE|nr:E3 ubiquitin-protein ligase RNF12-B-like [Penaeus monodon]